MTELQARTPEAVLSRPRSRWVVGVLVLVVVLAGVVLLVRHHQREQEWQHGGDDVEFQATVDVTSDSGFADAVVAAGGDRNDAIRGVSQGLVVSVAWSSPEQARGSNFYFVLLDRRVTPPRILRTTGASAWGGAFDVLADHYPWLERTRSVEGPDGFTNDTMAPWVPAGRGGKHVLAFAVRDSDLPITDPAKDLVLGVILTRDGDEDEQVRSAKQVEVSTR